MNGLDVLVLIFVLLTVFHFSMKGFLGSVIILLGWTLSIFAFTQRYLAVEKQIFGLPLERAHLGSYAVSGFIALVILWFFYYLCRRVEIFVGNTGFSEGDRILGVLLGLCLGWHFSCCILLILTYLFPLEETLLWQNSQLVPMLQSTQEKILPIFLKFLDRWKEYSESN